VEDFAPSRRALLMPDTNVYIKAGALSALVQDLVERALLSLLGLPGRAPHAICQAKCNLRLVDM
jgi:hypothetical protein